MAVMSTWVGRNSCTLLRKVLEDNIDGTLCSWMVCVLYLLILLHLLVPSAVTWNV